MESTEFTSEALAALKVRPVERSEEGRYQEQMASHHYLGALPKIGETVWYVATWREQWVAQLNISAAALKCGVRDRWIGWDFRSQYGRLNLIANNSRFLILPDWHRPNVGSRVLSLTTRRIVADWQTRFGHPLLLLETFMDDAIDCPWCWVSPQARSCAACAVTKPSPIGPMPWRSMARP
jgi:hypothetical protein